MAGSLGFVDGALSLLYTWKTDLARIIHKASTAPADPACLLRCALSGSSMSRPAAKLQGRLRGPWSRDGWRSGASMPVCAASLRTFIIKAGQAYGLPYLLKILQYSCTSTQFPLII